MARTTSAVTGYTHSVIVPFLSALVEAKLRYSSTSGSSWASVYTFPLYRTRRNGGVGRVPKALAYSFPLKCPVVQGRSRRHPLLAYVSHPSAASRV